jgi:YD repeat-containing protein
MQAPVLKTLVMTTPSGLTRTQTATRSATLSNAADPLSLVTLVEAKTVNGRTTSSTYTAATHTHVVTLPTGRTTTTVLDAMGRTISSSLGSLAPITYAYDARGRLAAMTQAGRTSRSSTTHAASCNR